jgi:phospholipase/lecithinase/hemolysin
MLIEFFAACIAGFTDTSQGCCGNGLLAMGALCTSVLPQCRSPAQFMFFDSVHPTQAMSHPVLRTKPDIHHM